MVLSLKKAEGRVVLALGRREDLDHQNSELPFKDQSANHDDVTSSWLRACSSRGLCGK
jgi:hypothetical protein